MAPSGYPNGKSLTPSTGASCACPISKSILICICLVVLIIWVNSPNSFCSALDTVSDNVNGYALDPSLALAVYLPMVRAYKTAEALTAPTGRLQYVDVYVDDLICVAKGEPAHQ